MDNKYKIIEEIKKEMIAQRVKHPKCDHPSIDNKFNMPDATEEDLCAFYGIINESRAKILCDKATQADKLTWSHIAVEELAEVICAESDLSRRDELIQLAGVVISWIQSIDSNKESALSDKPSAVNHPSHYGGKDNPYEVIKVIRALGMGFNLGNTFKYIARAGKKDPAKHIEDLEKARFYLDDEIKTLKSV